MYCTFYKNSDYISFMHTGCVKFACIYMLYLHTLVVSHGIQHSTYILELLTVRILLGGLVNHVLSVLSSSAHEWSAACVSSHNREEGASEKIAQI